MIKLTPMWNAALMGSGVALLFCLFVGRWAHEFHRLPELIGMGIAGAVIGIDIYRHERGQFSPTVFISRLAIIGVAGGVIGAVAAAVVSARMWHLNPPTETLLRWFCWFAVITMVLGIGFLAQMGRGGSLGWRLNRGAEFTLSLLLKGTELLRIIGITIDGVVLYFVIINYSSIVEFLSTDFMGRFGWVPVIGFILFLLYYFVSNVALLIKSFTPQSGPPPPPQSGRGIY